MPPKQKESFTSNIPWDDVNANILRTLCATWGVHGSVAKANMIAFLHDLEKNGLEKALAARSNREESPEMGSPSQPAVSRPRTTSLKRKKADAVPIEEPAADGLPYNTRHKGQKRVRVTAPPLPRASPVRRKVRPATGETSAGSISAAGAASDPPVKRPRGRPPKSASAAGLSTANTTESGTAPVKRGRGRPRKSAVQVPPASTATGKPKQVFDGVVLMKARRSEPAEDEDADGEVDDELEGHLVVIPSAETSSLGSSNKGEYRFVLPV
ncbi:hypothetical protein DFP72DRAFT_895159 [Ephemerocybe angulata]|uniref:Uncharacterized protein n=1 Tax=Ephemerocybe angulata TaxID=980116 RepID=A0A8H6I1M9_9AGAR|nr:hypothetical protein DFP72DRAFT_895159 [Tulosesus angulatus]